VVFNDKELNDSVQAMLDVEDGGGVMGNMNNRAQDDPFDKHDGRDAPSPNKRRRTQPSFYKYNIHPHASSKKIKLVSAPGVGVNGSLWVSAELLIEYLLTASSEKQPAAVRLNPSLLAGGLADTTMSTNSQPFTEVRTSYRQATNRQYGSHILSGSNATPVSPRVSNNSRGGSPNLTPMNSAGGGGNGGGLLLRTPSNASRVSNGSAGGGSPKSPWTKSAPTPWVPSSPTGSAQRVKTSVQEMLADAQLRTLYNRDGSRSSMSRYMGGSAAQRNDAAFIMSGGESPVAGDGRRVSANGGTMGTGTTSLFYSGTDDSRISYGDSLGTVLELGAGLGAPSIALALNGKARRIICTDRRENLPLLRKNLEANRLHDSNSVVTRQLQWGNAEDVQNLNMFDLAARPGLGNGAGHSGSEKIDYIIGADVAYSPEDCDKLVETILALSTPWSGISERVRQLKTGSPTNFEDSPFDMSLTHSNSYPGGRNSGGANGHTPTGDLLRRSSFSTFNNLFQERGTITILALSKRENEIVHFVKAVSDRVRSGRMLMREVKEVSVDNTPNPIGIYEIFVVQ
jgi:hypothetical protein